MKLILKMLTVTLFAVSLTGLQAQEKSGKTLLISLASDQGLRTGMALNFGRMSLKKGTPVVLWMNAEAVKLASKDSPESETKKMLLEFISMGGKVYVCPMSSQKMGITKLIDGAEFAKFEVISPLLHDPNVTYLSW